MASRASFLNTGDRLVRLQVACALELLLLMLSFRLLDLVISSGSTRLTANETGVGMLARRNS